MGDPKNIAFGPAIESDGNRPRFFVAGEQALHAPGRNGEANSIRVLDDGRDARFFDSRFDGWNQGPLSRVHEEKLLDGFAFARGKRADKLKIFPTIRLFGDGHVLISPVQPAFPLRVPRALRLAKSF